MDDATATPGNAGSVNSNADPSAAVNPASDSFAKASSELNNLLQIISSTSALIETESKEGSEEYLAMLRASIERAENIAADLARQAGGTSTKSLMRPELAGGGGSKNVESSESSKRSIVLVDDEEMALTLVKRILSDAGYNVTTTSSGFQCLDVVRRQPHAYDLVLLDLSMPFMDGEETFKRLREIRADLPIVLCTGFIQQERLNRLMTSGLSGFLRKPIAPDEIVSFVRSTLASVKYTRGNFDPHSAPASI